VLRRKRESQGQLLAQTAISLRRCRPPHASHDRSHTCLNCGPHSLRLKEGGRRGTNGPVLMIRVLIVGYVFAIRSERRIYLEALAGWAATFWRLAVPLRRSLGGAPEAFLRRNSGPSSFAGEAGDAPINAETDAPASIRICLNSSNRGSIRTLGPVMASE
jgi:hypothetical protein